jgi:hypothetical protein
MELIIMQLSEALDSQEIMERQRSRVEWLREGDRTTAKARARARGDKIRGLKNDAGDLICEQEQMETMASQFFQELFTAREDLDLALVCKDVPRKITEPMGGQLLDRAFTGEEVERALFQMSPHKAPRPDGFTSGFFKKTLGFGEGFVHSRCVGLP